MLYYEVLVRLVLLAEHGLALRSRYSQHSGQPSHQQPVLACAQSAQLSPDPDAAGPVTPA
jgi:hypothetical protein